MGSEPREAIEPDPDFIAITKQLLALVVAARRISAMIGEIPDELDAEEKAAEAA